MKKISILKFCIILLCLLPSKFISAQTFNCYIANDHLVSTTVYEFDVYIVSTSADFLFRTAQHCFSFNPAFIPNTATVTASYVAGSSNLTSYLLGTITWSQAGSGFQVATNTGVTCGTGTLISTTPIRIGTFKMESTLPFNCAASNPNMIIPGDTVPAGLSLRMAITKWTNTNCIPATSTTITNNGIFSQFAANTGYDSIANMHPIITSQPLSASTACNSGAVNFSVTATGSTVITSSITYQWLENGVPVTNGTTANGVYSGAATPTLTIANPTGALVGHQFVCVVTQCNSDTTIAVSITGTSNDNNACTLDSCVAATGSVLHIPTNTDDNNPCTADACDPATGAVTHTQIVTNDNNACTTDGCDPVTGVFHTPLNTNDNNPCTDDACDPANGNVTHAPVNTNDNNACTNDGCDQLTGVYHDAINTNDNNACTLDNCNPATGVISHTAINTDDGSACTTDGCDQLTGVFHTPVNINDGNSCTADACDSITGIITHTNITSASPALSVSDTCGYSVLQASGFSGTLLWSTGATSATITVTSSGLYSVTQNIGGCISPPGVISASPFSVPAVSLGNDTSLSPGSSLSLNAGSGFLSYMWSNGAATQSINVQTSGTYWVSVTNNNCANSDTVVVDFNLNIVNSPLENNISIYPNPSNGNFSILFDKPTKNCRIEIFNSIDKSVYYEVLKNVNSHFTKFLRQNLAQGIYLIRITTDEGIVVKNVVIE